MRDPTDDLTTQDFDVPAHTEGERGAPATSAPEPSAPESEEDMHAGFVAILGKPNVGKSTLLNTLLGVKVAPISPKPQTTRRGVRGIHTDVERKRQLVFVDTPGMHEGRTELDAFMGREIRGAVADVEVVLWVVDLRRPPSDEDRAVVRLLNGIDPDTPIYLIGNKLDAAKYPDEAMDLYAELVPRLAGRYALSAQHDPRAVHDLRDDLLERLPEGPFHFPDGLASDQTREQWAAELVRESAMIHLRQELPYTVAVQILEWRDPEDEDDAPIVITAELWVEKRQHKPIAVGHGGAMIKAIGRSARKQLQIFLDHQVYLDLEVVVRHDWRQDPEALRELGYGGA